MRLRDRGRIDVQLATAIFGLAVFGLLMLYSASADLSRVATGSATNSTYYLILQLEAFGVGMVAWILLQLVDYHKYQKWMWWWFGVTAILLISVIFISKGEVNGAHRWISVFGQTFQPSEISKLTLILFLASWFSRQQSRVTSWTTGLLPFLLIIGAISALMLKQRDLGSLGVLVCIAVAMYVVAGAKLSQISTVILAMCAVVVTAIKIAPYRLARITAFLNPDAATLGTGYHISQAKISIGLGGLWGKGFLQGVQKQGFLPEAHTDSIFAVVVEELGFLRASLVVLVFGFIGLRGLRVAKYAPDMFGTLLAVGITTWFVSQALINMSAMVSLVPLTGVPLPFISFGRSALVAAFMATGVLLNISRHMEAK
ncbi:MAG: putative peptidoglycan glycosyltransferase FtsW [Patescibacteria group bacterium]